MAKLKRRHAISYPARSSGYQGSVSTRWKTGLHQIKAEEFATKEENKRKLSPAQAARIRAKAKRLLGN